MDRTAAIPPCGQYLARSFSRATDCHAIACWHRLRRIESTQPEEMPCNQGDIGAPAGP